MRAISILLGLVVGTVAATFMGIVDFSAVRDAVVFSYGRAFLLWYADVSNGRLF